MHERRDARAAGPLQTGHAVAIRTDRHDPGAVRRVGRGVEKRLQQRPGAREEDHHPGRLARSGGRRAAARRSPYQQGDNRLNSPRRANLHTGARPGAVGDNLGRVCGRTGAAHQPEHQAGDHARPGPWW